MFTLIIAVSPVIPSINAFDLKDTVFEAFDREDYQKRGQKMADSDQSHTVQRIMDKA